MGYQIEAFLEDGKPSLKIYDFEKKNLCLRWTYHDSGNQNSSSLEVQRLFRDLILLTCKQDLYNVRLFNFGDAANHLNNA